ncbi:hypothetical protein [Escherichia coli]|uniref:hypothetical protein n=2 Tax=Escherichia coli TaxID=562 RepID=UPI0012FF9AE1|nr:hypothetical protein [Escherichia coli]EFC4783218.1 hypothetical protein [Escherichia coli]EJP0416670.1 hypothetical protein [Escherichia coli]HDT6124192.1 hypothetical protein [Escherichia coli]
MTTPLSFATVPPAAPLAMLCSLQGRLLPLCPGSHLCGPTPRSGSLSPSPPDLQSDRLTPGLLIILALRIS